MKGKAPSLLVLHPLGPVSREKRPQMAGQGTKELHWAWRDKETSKLTAALSQRTLLKVWEDPLPSGPGPALRRGQGLPRAPVRGTVLDAATTGSFHLGLEKERQHLL